MFQCQCTYILMFLQPKSGDRSLTLATATEIEAAQCEFRRQRVQHRETYISIDIIPSKRLEPYPCRKIMQYLGTTNDLSSVFYGSIHSKPRRSDLNRLLLRRKLGSWISTCWMNRVAYSLYRQPLMTLKLLQRRLGICSILYPKFSQWLRRQSYLQVICWLRNRFCASSLTAQVYLSHFVMFYYYLMRLTKPSDPIKQKVPVVLNVPELCSLKISDPKILLLVCNAEHVTHCCSRPHPETQLRIAAVISYLKENPVQGLVLAGVGQLNEQQAEKTVKCIETVHGEHYRDKIESIWMEGVTKPEMFINRDTYYCSGTYVAARSAVKTVLDLLDRHIQLKVNHSFALIRPPGHHCGMKQMPHGFSFFNNVAIAVHRALELGQKKVVIVDWDVHHGDGTQKLFYTRKDVLYISMHRFDKGMFFPHLKQANCTYTGQGAGQGFNINICWDLPEKTKQQTYKYEETVGDREYIECFDRIVMPVLRQFDPEMVFISCGFDAMKGQDLGKLRVTELGFAYMTQCLMSLKKSIFLVLEGGYTADALRHGVRTVAETLVEGKMTSDNEDRFKMLMKEEKEPNSIGQLGIKDTVEQIGQFWNLKGEI